MIKYWWKLALLRIFLTYLYVCLAVLLSVCLSVIGLTAVYIVFLIIVQDVLYTGLDALTSKVHSLEDKYVKFLYKKVQSMEKCHPCRPQTQIGKNV